MLAVVLASALLGQCSSGACGASARAYAFAPQQQFYLAPVPQQQAVFSAPVLAPAVVPYGRSVSYSETSYGYAPAQAYAAGYEKPAKQRRGLLGRLRGR